MKIGILTLAQETNYGGILQSFALQTVLKRMGHDVYTIDRHKHRKYASFQANFLSFAKRLNLRYLQGKEVSTSWNPFMPEDVYRVISMNTRDFVRRNMTMTRECRFDEMKEIDSEYLFDAYIVGSDQVWLPAYYPSSFLEFVTRSNVLKITYAASCSKKTFLDKKGAKEGVRKLAKDFVGISVREDSLIDKTEKYLGRKPVHVLDPTMLLSPSDYLSVIKDNVREGSSVFAYILDNDEFKNNIIDSVASIKGKSVSRINPPKQYIKGITKDISECIFPSIDDWIYDLSQSEFVVTDSFHGTVFAILFNKPFISIGNAKRGLDRFLSLLKMFHLEDRLILKRNNSVDINKLIKDAIDFTLVNQILFHKRVESINYLTKCLNFDERDK